MATIRLSKDIVGRFSASPKCPIASIPVTSVSNYLAVLDTIFKGHDSPLWFRGHSDHRWQLRPSALRPNTPNARRLALSLLGEFKRIADFRLTRPPAYEDNLRWMQLAQHNGLPTRLLDWTSNAAVALYFACLRLEHDGAVFLMNPTDLNLSVTGGVRRLITAEQDGVMVNKYYNLSTTIDASHGLPNIAIQPVINSERIQLQRGYFTLHGNRFLDLKPKQLPTLCFIPILKEDKSSLMRQLGAIGIDEISIFPEVEHVCSHLRRQSGL